MADYVFSGTKINSIYFYGDVPQNINALALQATAGIDHVYVPGEYFDNYYDNGVFTVVKSCLAPMGKYISNFPQQITMEVGTTKQIDFKIFGFNTNPTVTITSNRSTVATGGNVNISGENGYFIIQANYLSSDTKLTITIEGDGYSVTREIDVFVVDELVPGTYEVVNFNPVLKFNLNADGFYESSNKGVDNSYCMCRVDINNPSGLAVHFDCINYAETNYDYGILSTVDSELNQDTQEDTENVYHSFRGLSSPDIQTITYYDANGECSIYVKYIKDTSGAQDNDSLQFKVRFGD